MCGRKLETIAQEEFWVWFLKGCGRGGGEELAFGLVSLGGEGRGEDSKAG